MDIALIIPIADDALANIDYSRMIAYVPRQALRQNSPELLSVLGAGLYDIELIANALCNVALAVVFAELVIEIGYRACKAQKLLAAELIEFELFPVFRGYNAGCLARAKDGIR